MLDLQTSTANRTNYLVRELELDILLNRFLNSNGCYSLGWSKATDRTGTFWGYLLVSLHGVFTSATLLGFELMLYSSSMGLDCNRPMFGLNDFEQATIHFFWQTIRAKKGAFRKPDINEPSSLGWSPQPSSMARWLWSPNPESSTFSGETWWNPKIKWSTE